MKIIISALRRSGSTIFWKCFRESTTATCFDEPFNPKLSQLPKEHKKRVYKEYIDYLRTHREEFWNIFSPIYPLDELKPDFSYEQANYLRHLLNISTDVVVDTTRCWCKINSLNNLTDSNTFLIHLHRSASGFVASHLIPSDDKGYRAILRKWKRKRSFWTRNSDFNKWNMEDVCGRDPLSAFSLQILKDNATIEKFYNAPAVLRLLKFWSVAFLKVENEGREAFGDRFISISFEEFCQNPTSILDVVAYKTGLEFDFKKLPLVKASNNSFMGKSKKWDSAAEYWNLSESLDRFHR